MLYEPVGSLGPEEEQLKNVIWVQSRAGQFIDIRYQDGVTIHSKMKSFAGEGSFDSATQYFTWRRDFDFRPPGSPDVGLMRVLQGSVGDPHQLEEDGVLPGDDYREIWDKLSGSNDVGSDCSVRLLQKLPDGSVDREGLFLIVGTWFALTLSRPRSKSAAGEQQLRDIFADGGKAEESFPEDSYLWEYVTALGHTTSWEVQFALHSAIRGASLLPGRCTHPSLAALFTTDNNSSTTSSGGGQWYWEVLHGTLPAALAGSVLTL